MEHIGWQRWWHLRVSSRFKMTNVWLQYPCMSPPLRICIWMASQGTFYVDTMCKQNF